MSHVFVAEVESFGPGSRAIVTLDGRDIVVINYDGDYYAILNRCAHDGGPLCEGSVHERLVADVTEPGERDIERFSDEPAITCPLHGWEYDLTSGHHVGEGDIRLPTFEVIEEEGELYVMHATDDADDN